MSMKTASGRYQMKNQSTNSAGACSGTKQMLWHLLQYLLNGKFVICRRSETLSDKKIYLRQLWLFGLFNWTIYFIVLFYCFIVLLYLFVEDLCTTILKYKFEIQINKPSMAQSRNGQDIKRNR